MSPPTGVKDEPKIVFIVEYYSVNHRNFFDLRKVTSDLLGLRNVFH
jgi:hypothetical protein